MVFKGSQGIDPGGFDLEIEAVGGVSNAATGFDDVHYCVILPPEALNLALDLLPRLVLRPSLAAEAFQLERQVVLEELAQSEDQPDEQAFQKLLTLACGSHPYGRPILGSRADLMALTPASMAAFQKNNYHSHSCAMAVGGRFDPELVLSKLQQGPVAYLPEGPIERPVALQPLQLKAGEHRLKLPRLESARLLMAWQCPAAAEQEALSGYEIWASLLGEGRRSRLVARLREELQLVEAIDLEIQPLEQGSLAILEAVCDPAQLNLVRSEVNKVLNSLDNGISDKEWQRAQRLLAHGHSFGLEAPSQVTHLLGHSTLLNRLQSLDAPLQRLQEWGIDRLQDLAAAWQPEQACVLEVRPA
jgi:predicted Zn-dependent peptidase